MLLHSLEQAKMKYVHEKENEFITTVINLAWEKLSMYYLEFGRSPAYITALVINPCQKWQYNGRQWKDGSLHEYIPLVGAKVLDIWSLYKPTQAETLAREASEELDILDSFLHKALPLENQEDPYEAYCLAKPARTDNLYKRWTSQRDTYGPELTRMALDHISIPAMSAEYERGSSSAKHLVTDTQNRLQGDIIEASECLRSWYRMSYFGYYL